MLQFFHLRVNSKSKIESMKKKQTFVLLEIVMAFAIVSIAILPFFRYPYQHMCKEMEILFEMELERHAQNKLAEVYEFFMKREIPDKILFGDQKQKDPYQTNTITIKLGEGFTRNYQEKLFIDWTRQKLSNDRIVYSLNHFKITYSSFQKKKGPVLSVETEAVAQKKI